MSLKHGDLKGTIEPRISIDEFEPKSGTEAELIVVGFYALDEGPASDLDEFIEKSPYDIIDVDVSPNPDQEGKYMVFAEFKRNPSFFKMLGDIIRDIENLTGKQKWVATTRGLDYDAPLDDEAIISAVIVDPVEFTEYEAAGTPEDEAGTSNDEVQVEEFFAKAYGSKAKLNEGQLELSGKTGMLCLEFIDMGDASKLIEKHNLTAKPVSYLSQSYQYRMLCSMLGEGWEITNLTDVAVIHNSDTDNVILVKI